MAISTIGQNGITNPLPSLTTNTVTSAPATALAIQSGGTTAITVDASQNVGINATPSAWSLAGGKAIQLSSSTAIWNYAGTNSYFSNNEYYNGSVRVFLNNGWATEYTQAAGTHVWFTSSASGTAGGTATMNQVMALDTSGNLLLGTTSNSVNGRASKQAIVQTGTADTINISQSSLFYFTMYSYVNAGTGSNTRYHIGFGDTGATPTQALGFITTNGSAVTYSTVSDYRLKENVAPMTGALDTVQQLKPVNYTWKSTGEASQGFIAHELAEVVPECVTGEKDAVDAEGNPVYQGIDTSFLVATLTAAIQELNAKVDAQAAEIAALKGAK